MKFQLDIRIVKAAVCLLAVLALFLGVLYVLNVWEEGGSGTAEPADAYADETGIEQTYYNGAWYEPRSGLETLLVLGIDKYAEFDGPVQGEYEQSDFVMLLVFDKKAGVCSAMPINRDTMVDFEMLDDLGRSAGTAHGQLTLAHAYGGSGKMRCRNTAKAVSQLLYGVKIDHYLSLTMDGVAALNDLIGGVPVKMEEDLTAIDKSFVQGETVTLNGSQALAFVRARKGVSDGSNVSRMNRQTQYLEALQERISANMNLDEGFIMDLLEQVNPYMVSDCTIQKLSELSELLSENGILETLRLEGEADNSGEFAEFRVDEEALQALVMDFFYEKVDG